MKYQIMHDYYTEGMKFYNDTEYDTVAEALDVATKCGYSSPFLIVHVVDWKKIKYEA